MVGRKFHKSFVFLGYGADRTRMTVSSVKAGWKVYMTKEKT